MGFCQKNLRAKVLAVAGVLVASCSTADGGHAPGRGARAGTGASIDGATIPGAQEQPSTGGFDNAAPPQTSGMVPATQTPTPEPRPQGGECGASSVEAEQVIIEEVMEIEEVVMKPLDIYMIVDDSGSMVPWWPFTLDALNMFFTDPGSEGIGVGLQFFGSSCEASVYANPRVPVGELPGSLQNLQGAFPILPVEGTATLPAMQGAIQYARARTESHPDRTIAVLLVTDGLPDECGSTVQNVTDVIADGYTGTPSISTFVVGLGFDLNALNGFAAAGGTGQATLVNPAVATELLTALQTVRDAVIETRVERTERVVERPLECEWQIPSDSGPNGFDRELVNVQLSSGAGASTPMLGKVPSRQECAAMGWHFDEPDSPSRIVACPQTCEIIQATPQARVDILLGCETVPLL
ncbi:MAG: VWA domain-containing protein [Myxococcales bacterium]|nr:VWA domain-containing protein [Myxococcales bacterium]